jgi:hypothetical protein
VAPRIASHWVFEMQSDRLICFQISFPILHPCRSLNSSFQMLFLANWMERSC